MAKKTEKQFREEVEQLNKEYGEVRDQRTRFMVLIENARQQKEQFAAEFKKEFGTADLNELLAILEQRLASNEDGVQKYREAIRKQREEQDLVAQKIAQINSGKNQ